MRPATPRKASELLKTANGSAASTGSVSSVTANGHSLSEKLEAANGSSAASYNGSSTASFSGSSYTSATSTSSSYSYSEEEIIKERHELGTIFTEAPWMKFRVIAEPDMSIFMKDIRIQAIIRKITHRSVTEVKKQLVKEFTETITNTMNQLISSMTETINIRMQNIEESVVKQFTSDMTLVKVGATATCIEGLGKCPDHCICGYHDTHHDHHEEHYCHPPSFQNAHWIWSKDFQNCKHVARPFRKTLSFNDTVNFATIDITCDNFYTLYVNGKLVGSGEHWDKPDRYTVRFEPTKKVIIAIYAVQETGVVGLLASGTVWNSQEKDPKGHDFVTDKTWLTSLQPVSGEFIKTDFVETGWESASEQFEYGKGHWNQLSTAAAGRMARRGLPGNEHYKAAPEAKIANVVFPGLK